MKARKLGSCTARMKTRSRRYGNVEHWTATDLWQVLLLGRVLNCPTTRNVVGWLSTNALRRRGYLVTSPPWFDPRPRTKAVLATESRFLGMGTPLSQRRFSLRWMDRDGVILDKLR